MNICIPPTETAQILTCPICPRSCRLAPGQTGNCRARANLQGQIVPLAYNSPCSLGLDPIEKKPLFHFYPGSKILSIGTAGCNLHCKNCQNAEISQVSPRDIPGEHLSPDMLVNWLVSHKIDSVAYTYNEPLVAFEYVYDCAKAVHAAGYKNVLVSAGYVNPGPLQKLLPYLDGANIDLKTMDPEGYRSNCGVEPEPVLNTLRTLAHSDCVLEVTNLVIPGFNDRPDNLKRWCDFIASELGTHIPVHFSRFFPLYKMQDRPVTPLETLELAKTTAHEAGLKYIYCGNVPGAEITNCPQCGKPLIVRNGFNIMMNKLKDGHCPDCNSRLYGRF